MAFGKVLVVATVVGLAVYLQGCGGGGGGGSTTTTTTTVDLGNTISGVASNTSDLSTLVTALSKADLVATLAGPGPFTVFAPTNEAFAKLPNSTLAALLADKKNLTKVLEYHVVSGKYLSANLKNKEQLKTLEGKNITVTIGTSVKIDNATVITANVSASNGVVHLIDSVMLPPGFVPPTVEKADLIQVV